MGCVYAELYYDSWMRLSRVLFGPFNSFIYNFELKCFSEYEAVFFLFHFFSKEKSWEIWMVELIKIEGA